MIIIGTDPNAMTLALIKSAEIQMVSPVALAQKSWLVTIKTSVMIRVSAESVENMMELSVALAM